MLESDTFKIHLSDQGYLPDYPPHLISYDEMCEAFLKKPASNIEFQYFDDFYPLVDEKLYAEYEELKRCIRYYFARFNSSVRKFRVKIPDWVWQYMLGAVVSVGSTVEDRHWLLTHLNCDNIDDEITVDFQDQCFRVSTYICNSILYTSRYLNLRKEIDDYTEDEKSTVIGELEEWGAINNSTNLSKLDTRPPSMFGEQNIVKFLRLRESN